MSAIQIPKFGILLDCHPKTMDALPQQAIAINLNDNILEDMIKAVQDGHGIELSTGSNPSFSYASHTHPATSTPEPFLFDLFVTRPERGMSKAAKYPNSTTGILGHKGTKHAPARSEKMPVEKPSRSSAPKAATSSKAKATNKHLSGTSAATSSASRSLPPSPLSISGSPALNPTLSASQQAVSRAKEHRFPIVHELAVREQTEEYLLKRWKGAKEDFKPALEKAADFITSSRTWALKKNIWKELDVYKYDYAHSEDRQLAIDNAIKQYDRIRLSATEPEWQRLLPVEERGKGKSLSKLQATIAKASSAPKIKVQKAEALHEPGTSTDEQKSDARSTSRQPKPKGTNIFNGGGTTIKKPAPKARTKAATAKAPTKAGVKEKARVLSAAYISNSDDDGSEDEPLSKGRNTTPLAVPTPSQKTSKASSPRPKALSSLPPKPPKSVASKRAREEDDSSSSSGAPLSKRYKQPSKEPTSNVIRAPINKPAANAAAKKSHHASDATSHSRGTANSTALPAPASKATKTTSPTKSSPLASSPPTNASDLDGEGETPPPPPVHKHYSHSRGGSTNSAPGKRRRMDDNDDRERIKKPRVSTDVVHMASRFKSTYTQYERLHFELKDLDDPPESKVAMLLEMRSKLESLKKEIYQGVDEGNG